ncbi:MAG: site-specific DNA-methyltransferase, partial [Planctomycetes bacterium]|nr:site-specific DNA-methyltransferase [Planctomycetota bacterium]
KLGRKWISFEINEEYVESSQMRFEENPKTDSGLGIKNGVKKKKPA